MSLVLLSHTQTESPVDLTGFKNHIGFAVADTSRDESFALLLEAATDDAQAFTGLQFMPALFEQQMGTYHDVIALESFPVTGIDSVKYFDASNNEIELVSGTDYYAQINSNPAIIQFNTVFAPSTERPDAIRIRFGAGYTAAANVPPLIKAAILMSAADMYVNPSDAVRGLPTASRNLLRQYRSHRVIRRD